MDREFHNWTEVWDNDADAEMDDYFPFDFDYDDLQPTELQEWLDYDPDC